MRENRVKHLLEEGQTAIGTMITEARSPAIAQMLAVAGFDFVFIDMEHGAFNMETVEDIVRVARLAGITPLVRVPNPEYHLLSRPLDQGAQGLMLPRVEDRATVKKVVDGMKYPPIGSRGCAITRGHSDYREERQREFCDFQNRETMVIIQIERKRAIEQIDELVSVPGVDVALMGMNDLTLSLGASSTTAPEVIAAAEKVIDACHRHGVVSGIHIANVGQLQDWMRKGMRMITCSSEIGFLYSAATAAVKELRVAAGRPADVGKMSGY